MATEHGPAAWLAELDAVVAAISHPARRQILLTIRFLGGLVAAGDIARRFACKWPTTTRHLRTLEEAGLLASERRGRSRLYRLELSRLEALKQWLVWLETGAAPKRKRLRPKSPSRKPREAEKGSDVSRS